MSKKQLKQFGLGAAAVLGNAMSLSAFAVPPTTIAELTAGISFADVSLGVLAVAALLTTVYVGWRAAKFVIQAVKGM